MLYTCSVHAKRGHFKLVYETGNISKYMHDPTGKSEVTRQIKKTRFKTVLIRNMSQRASSRPAIKNPSDFLTIFTPATNTSSAVTCFQVVAGTDVLRI